jgi:hypothetical protein
MRFNCKDRGELDVTWKYDRIKKKIDKRTYDSVQTTCTISTFEPSPEAKGKKKLKFTPITKAICSTHSKENFCKSNGRKRSLLKALKSIGINDREERRKIWSSYFKQVDLHQLSEDMLAEMFGDLVKN